MSYFECRVSSVRGLRIAVRCGKFLDAIILSHQDLPNRAAVRKHEVGGSGGAYKKFEMEADEYIVKVQTWSCDFVDAIKFVTNKGNCFGKFGGDGGRYREWNAREGYGLVGFKGRAGNFIDEIQPIEEPVTSTNAKTYVDEHESGPRIYRDT